MATAYLARVRRGRERFAPRSHAGRGAGQLEALAVVLRCVAEARKSTTTLALTEGARALLRRPERGSPVRHRFPPYMPRACLQEQPAAVT